jgi:hypothetical protein
MQTFARQVNQRSLREFPLEGKGEEMRSGEVKRGRGKEPL